jgi:hypothetical protein
MEQTNLIVFPTQPLESVCDFTATIPASLSCWPRSAHAIGIRRGARALRARGA